MPLDRRTFLGSLAALTVPPAALAYPLATQSRRADVTILLDQELGKISPLLYGQFAEHIGTLVYGGIWVGRDSKIPNKDGFRLDALEALKRVKTPVVRWPGGCFADAYHWEDAVGPVAQRKKERNHWWLREEPNTFGTDEFISWCRLLDAQPYLSVNVGSGTVSEALRWLEYCNGTGDQGAAAARVKNGHKDPYNVVWWGIGNENWGCGGQMTAAEYAQQYRQYAVYFKRLGLSSGLELVGVGHIADDWNRKFLEALGGGLPYLDHLSIHRYFRRGHSTNFSDDQYTDLMLDVIDFEKLIQDALSAIDAVEPLRARIPLFGQMKRKPIGLIIDEWGAWHDDAKLDDGFRQNGVLREAVFAASCLNMFHRYPARLTMTNIAQAINCLQALLLADDKSLVLTPTYHVYEMFRPHQGATSVRVDISGAPTISRGKREQASLNASASRNGKALLVTLVNQDAAAETEAVVSLTGGTPKSAKATVLSGANVRAMNTPDQPNAVAPKPLAAEVADGKLRLRVPAASIVAVGVDIG
ncbi:MAG: alpha-N-arabinofuranosidase [Planctomycetaceae bacterium]